MQPIDLSHQVEERQQHYSNWIEQKLISAAWETQGQVSPSLFWAFLCISFVYNLSKREQSLYLSLFSQYIQTTQNPNACLLVALTSWPPSVSSMVSLRVVGALRLARDHLLPLHLLCRLMGLTDWCSSWWISGQASGTDWLKTKLEVYLPVRGWRGGCSSWSLGLNATAPPSCLLIQGVSNLQLIMHQKF